MIHRRPVSRQAADSLKARRNAARLPAGARLLEATVSPFAGATTAPHGEGLRVSRPVPRPWWGFPPISWVVPVPTTRTVDLDTLGREVYESIGTSRRVEDVIESFATEHRLPFEDARSSVSRFLQLLLGRGMVTLEAGAEG